MLLELLSTSNYISFNITLAKIVGLRAAIYLSQVTDINDKAVRKNKVDEEGFFKVDRKYIESRTTLTSEEQRSIEADLAKSKILRRHPEKHSTIAIDLSVLTTIVMSPDEDLVKDISALCKTKKAKTKQEAIVENLKNCITVENPELQQAYEDWIDSVIEKKGAMTRVAVEEGIRVVDRFSNHNLDVALAVIKEAAIKGYDDMRWGVDNYKNFQQRVTSGNSTYQKSAVDSVVVPQNYQKRVDFGGGNIF